MSDNIDLVLSKQLIIIFVIAAFLVFLVFLYLHYIMRPKNFPPGPVWLPIVGNNLEMRKLSKKLGGFHLALLELSKQYNTNVLGLKLGSEMVVTVFNYSLIKTVLNSDKYNARPTNFFMKLRCLGNIKGITCTDGEFHNVQKMFLLKNFRTLGFGRKVTEELIQNQVNDIIKDINDDTNVQIEKLIAPAVISVLWSVIAGSHLYRKDPQLNKLLELFERRGKVFDISGGILGQLPWLRFIAPERTGYKMIQLINNELKEFFMKTIEEHHQTWSKENDGDFIYSFITEMKKQNAHYSFTDDQLLMLCIDLFIAGAKTTSSNLNFAFLMMLHYPDVQAKIQHILDDAFAKDHFLNYGDRQKFPYIEAVLLEVERYCSIAPIVGPRRVLEDTDLAGYTIPKNATVLIHAHAVHMSAEYWNEPHKFIPERFLNDDGSVIHHDELLTFSSGKRKCIGELLAKTFIFIFFTEILKHYTVIRGPGDKMVSGEGMILSANYSARFIKR